jgi:hypothetical protein
VNAAAGVAPVRLTWGAGSQLRAGFRYIFTDQIQLDGTCGTGIFGEPKVPIWFTSGVRLVTPKLW